MDNRRKENPSNDEEHESRIERVERREELPALGYRHPHEPHPTQQHCCMEKGVTPREPFEISIPQDTATKRHSNHECGNGCVQGDTP